MSFAQTLSIFEQKQYLENANILHIQQAARAAGLAFKNGALNKQGLINKVSQSNMMLALTVDNVHNLTRGNTPFRPPAQNPLADDLNEPASEAKPAQGPGVPPEALTPIMDALHRLRGLCDTLGANDERQTRAVDNLSSRLTFALEKVAGIQTEIAEIRQRRPVVFTIGEKVSSLPVEGQHYLFPKLVAILESQDLPNRNAMLIGPAGSGKSSAARAFAKMKGLPLYSQPQVVDSFGILGFTSPNGELVETAFTRAWVSGGVFLIDEISMNGPDALGALNDALASGYAPLPVRGVTPRHPNCYVIAGDNSDTGASAKFSARQVLDGATLDRFARMDWPIDAKLEQALAGPYTAWLACVRAVRRYIDQHDIAHVGATPRAIIQGRDMLARADNVLSREDILQFTLKKGILAESWDQILRLPEVIAFLRG